MWLDSLLGAALTGLVAVSLFIRLPLLESVEFKAYDLRAKLRQNLNPPAEIVLVAIDEDSIARLGRWPWPRARLAEALDRLRAAGPKVIGLHVLLSEPENGEGLQELRRLEAAYRDLVSARKVTQRGVDFALAFSSAAVSLDSDSKLQAALAASRDTVLPLLFRPGAPGAAAEDPAAALASSSLPAPAGLDASILQGDRLAGPLPAFAEAAAGLGHVNLYAEPDGVTRREAPLVRHGQRLYPSFAVRLVMAYLDLKPEDLTFVPGRELRLGKLAVPLDAENRMAVTFNGPALETVRVVPFLDLMSEGKVDPSVFKGKIVIVGPTATGTATLLRTPVASDFPAVEAAADAVENILHERFLARPPWAQDAERGLVALVGLFIALVMPRLRALWALVLALLLALGLLGSGTFLFTQGQWLRVGYPLALLAAGTLVIIGKRLLAAGKEGKPAAPPAPEAVKPASAPGRVPAGDPARLAPVEAAVSLPAVPAGAASGGAGLRRLGRYELEKELERGPAGAVYLGREAGSGRAAVIKTARLEAGGDGADSKESKELLRREAASAAALEHPNIARVFEAGEEDGFAFAALEPLEGQDLARHAAKDALLPLETVLAAAAAAADALDHAHARGVVHRAFTPGSLTRLEDGSIRVTGFGLSRVPALSKTEADAAGAPFYMSPEQAAGKKVDGRSDLFSLAAALFELATGEKPFKGGEGVGTLLFQIANDPHPDPSSLRAGLPPSLKAVIDKGLAKRAEERYARGGELAAALRAVLAELKGGAPAAQPGRTAPSAPTPTPPDARAVSVSIPALGEAPAPAPSSAPAPAPLPAPLPAVPGPARKLGPTIPDWTTPSKEKATPAAAAAPTAPPPDHGLRIEPPQRSGAGASEGLPPPPKKEFAADIPLPPPPKREGGLGGDVPPAPKRDGSGGLSLDSAPSPEPPSRREPDAQDPR